MADDSGVLAQNVGEGASECPIIQEANMKVKKSMAKSEAEPSLKANGIPSEKLKAEDNTGNDTSNNNNNNSGTNKWEDRLKLTREKQMESLKKRADGLKEAELKAEECRKKADDERKRKLEEMRKREEQHRVVVEERRKKMLESENEKRLALMKKSMGRDLKLDQLKQKNSDNKFLNGTKSPKQQQQQQHHQQQQQQSSPQQQQQQQVKRPHSVAGRPPSYASPTVASTTRMARSSEKDGEVITVCFRCRSAPPDFRSKFLEQQQHTSSGQNRSSHPVFSVTVPAVEFFSARSSVSNGHKDNKQLNGKFDMKPSIVLRPSETLSSKPPLPTISASSKGTVQQKPRPKRPVSAVPESSRESTLAMLEARNLKNLQMQKQSQTSASSPSSIDSKKKPKNRFDLSLDLKKDHSGDLTGDDVKPKRKELIQTKKRSLSAIPDRKKIADHDTGKSVFIAESSVGFSAATPYPSAKVLPSTGRQQTKVQKDMTNRLESKNRKLPVTPSAEVKKKDQLKERGTSAPKPSFLAPKTKQTPPSFEIKRPLPRLPKQPEQDGEKKKTEEKQEVTKTPVKDFPKDDVKKIHKQKDAKKAKEQVAKESKSSHETVPSKVSEVKAKDVDAKVKATETKVKPVEKVDKKVAKSEKVEKATPMTEKTEVIKPPGKTEQKAEEAAKVEHVESDKVIEQKENQQEQSEKDKEVSKTEANVETKEQKKVAENVDQPKDTEIEVREQAVAETNEEANQESTTPKTETKIAERDQEINKREQERLEKLKKDEEERLNRKKRVDLIMKRVKPDETSRSSSVEKESKSSDETIKAENKEEVTAAADVKAKEEKSQEPEEPEAKIDATDASSIETQESNLGEEEELNEENDGSKPGKSSFFDKLTSKLKKALSPSDKKGFPKTEQPINIQDVSGLLLLTALEKPKDETETSTSGEEGHPAAEISHERRESSGFGFFGRISKRQSKDISAEEKPLKQEDSSSSKDSSPPHSEGVQVTEKRKSITEAAFSMFGMMSKQKRPSKELEITPEENTTGMDGDKKPIEKEVPILDHEEPAKNVLPEEQLKDEEMNVIKDMAEQEEERVSPIVSEYVPGLEDEDDQERRTTRDRVDGMDDTVNSAVTSGSSKSPPKQVLEKPETKELGTAIKMEKGGIKTEKEGTKKKEPKVGKGEKDDKDLKQADDKETKEPSAFADATAKSAAPNTTTSDVPKATEVKPPEMINVTSPEMINIVVQKKDDELSTNLSNLDSNPSGSTSSLDIVKSEDSSSGDILMSDESPTEVRGQQEKERTDGKTTGIRKDDFDSSEQKAVMKEEASVCTDSLPGISEADIAATGLDASSSKFTSKEAILTNGYHDDLDEFFDNSVAQAQHVDKARYNGDNFNVGDMASSDAGKGQTDLQKIDSSANNKKPTEKTLEDKASQPQQVSEVNLNEQTKQRDSSTAQVSSERSMTLELKALASSQTLSSTMTTTSSVTISTGSLDSLQSETHLPSCEFVRSDLTSSEFTEIAQIDVQAESKLAAATDLRVDNLKKVDLKPSESHLFTDSTETAVGDVKEIEVKKGHSLGDKVYEMEIKNNETIPKNKIDRLELNLKPCTDQQVKQENISEAEEKHVINKDIESLTEMIPLGVNEPSGEKIGASPNDNIISISSSMQSDAPALEESRLTKSSVTPTSQTVQDGIKLERDECSVNAKHEIVQEEPLQFKETDEGELSAPIPDKEVKENLEIHDTKTYIDVAKVTDQTTDETKEPSHEQAFEISHIKHKNETSETEYSTRSADVNIIPSNVSACQTSISGVTMKSCTKGIEEKEHLDAKDEPAVCLDETRTDSNENKKVGSKEPSTQNDLSPLQAMTTEIKSLDKELQHKTVKALEQASDDVKSACDKKASSFDGDDVKTRQMDSSPPDSAVVKETQFNEVVQRDISSTRENDFVDKKSDMKQSVGQPSKAQIDMKKSEDQLSLTNDATSDPIKASKDLATLNEESPDRQIETNLEEIPSFLVHRLSVNEVKESVQFYTLEDPSEDLHNKSFKDGERPNGDQLTKIDQSEVSSKQIESPKEIIDHSGSKESTVISSSLLLDAIDKNEMDGSIEEATISVRTSTTGITACDLPSHESTLEWTQYSVMDSYKQTTDSRSVETSEDFKDFQKIDSNILSKTAIESIASNGDLQQLTLSKPCLHKKIDLDEETSNKIESDKTILLEKDIFSSADLSILQSLKQIENLDRSLSNGEEAEEASCKDVDAKVLGATKEDPSVNTSSEIKLEHSSPKSHEVKNTEIVSCLPDVEYKTLSLESKDPTFDDYVILSKTLEDEQKTFQDSKLTTLSDQLNEDSYFQDQHNTQNTDHLKEETDVIKHERSVIDAKDTSKTDAGKISEQQQLDEMSNMRPIIYSNVDQIMSETDNKIHPPKDSHGNVDVSFLSASKEQTTTSTDVHDKHSEMLHEIGKMDMERKEILSLKTALRDDNKPFTSSIGSSSTAEDADVSNQVEHLHHHQIDKQETKEELVKDFKMVEDDVKQPYRNEEGLLTEIKHQQPNQQLSSFLNSTGFNGVETMSKTIDLTELKVVGRVDKTSEEKFVQETTKEQTPETPVSEFKPEKESSAKTDLADEENRAFIGEPTQFAREQDSQEMKHSRSNEKKDEYELSYHTTAYQATKTLDNKELSAAKSLLDHQPESSPLASHESMSSSVETYLEDTLKMRDNLEKQKATLDNLLLVQGKQDKSSEQQGQTSKLEGDGQKPGILPLNFDFEKKETAEKSQELSESRDQIISSDKADVYELSERIARRVSQEVNEELLNGLKQVSKITTYHPSKGLSTGAVGLSETSRFIPNEKSTTSGNDVNESIDFDLNDGVRIAKDVSVCTPGDSMSSENIEPLRKMELVGQTICNVEDVQPSIVDSQPITNKERDKLDSVQLSEQVLARTDRQDKESEEPLFGTSSRDIVIDNVLQKEDKLIHFDDDVITKSISCHETSKGHFVEKTDDARFLDSLMTKDAVTTFQGSESLKTTAKLEEISKQEFKDPTASVVKGESCHQEKIVTASTSAEPIISSDRNFKDDEDLRKDDNLHYEDLMKDDNLHDEDLSESTGADLSDSFPITPKDKYADSVDSAFEVHEREPDEKVEPQLISVEQFIGHEVREDNFGEYPRRETVERSSDLTSKNGFNYDAKSLVSSQFRDSEQVFKSPTQTDESQKVDGVTKDAESAAATSGVVEKGELEKTEKQENKIEKFRENLLIDFESSKSDVPASIQNLTDEKDEVFEFKINKTESFAPDDTMIDSTSDKFHASRATPTTSTSRDISSDSLPAKHCDEVEFEDISSITIMPSIDRTSIVIKMTRPSSSSSPTDILFESDCPEATTTSNVKVVRDEGSFETGDSKYVERVMDVVVLVAQSTTSGAVPPEDDVSKMRPISAGKDVTVSNEENVTLQHESSAENKDTVQRVTIESLEKMDTSVRTEQPSIHDVNAFEGNHIKGDICDPYLKGSKGSPTMVFHDDDDDDSEVEDDSSDVDFKSEGDYFFGRNSWSENRKETLMRKRANAVSLQDMTPCEISKDFESEIIASHQGFLHVEAKQSPTKTMGDEVIQEINKGTADGVKATNDDSSSSTSSLSSSVTTENLGMQLTKSLITTAISLSDAKLGKVDERNSHIPDESFGPSNHVDAREDIGGKDRKSKQIHHQNYHPPEIGWTVHYPSVDCLTLMTSDMNRRLRSTFDLPSDRHPDDRDDVTKPKV